MNIKRVQQEDLMGCGVACVAMVTGRPYQQVRSCVTKYDVAHEGICDFTLRELLAVFGIPTITKGKGNWLTTERLNAVPLEPFAPAHIVCVDIRPKSGAHYVVLLPDGTVLDPNRAQPQRLSDYFDVHYIVGVFPPPTAPLGLRPPRAPWNDEEEKFLQLLGPRVYQASRLTVDFNQREPDRLAEPARYAALLTVSWMHTGALCGQYGQHTDTVPYCMDCRLYVAALHVLGEELAPLCPDQTLYPAPPAS